jgi:hypothetical protein
MSKPSEESKEKIWSYLDTEISFHKKRLESSVNMGWVDKADLCREHLAVLEPIRARLLEADELEKKYEDLRDRYERLKMSDA